MTRARLIEKVIAEWLEADGWRPVDGGEMVYEIDRGPAEVVIHAPGLSGAIDRELDRIIRETSKPATKPVRLMIGPPPHRMVAAFRNGEQVGEYQGPLEDVLKRLIPGMADGIEFIGS